MDPNETLREIRTLNKRVYSLAVNGRPDEYDVQRLCELFMALDDWILSGGFAPTDWQWRHN